MRNMSGDFLFFLFHFLFGVDAVGGDFDFGNAAEGKQKFYEVLGRLFRSLFHNVGKRVGDRGLEHHTFGLQAGSVPTQKAALNNSDRCSPPQPKFLLFQSLPQTLQPSESVIFVVQGYREFVSYSAFPWQIIFG